jgi:U6 snRNA-associated Sm-like protein LSm7
MAGNKKESALDLARFVDKGVRVKLAGGREGKHVVSG